MKEKELTAVEWLYQHLFPKQLDGFSEEEWSKIDVAFQQAKEMEKEQIIKTEDYLLVVDKNEWDGNNVLAETKLLDKNLTIYNFKPNKGDRKILAHLPLDEAPYLDGVDILPKIEDEVYRLSTEFCIKKEGRPKDLTIGFIEGYNKAKETYKYTEEDLRKAFQAGEARWGTNGLIDTEPNEDEFIKSINQPKLPIAFECEMEVKEIENAAEVLNVLIPKKSPNSEERTEWVGKYLF
jgi:hypothetical protein